MNPKSLHPRDRDFTRRGWPSLGRRVAGGLPSSEPGYRNVAAFNAKADRKFGMCRACGLGV